MVGREAEARVIDEVLAGTSGTSTGLRGLRLVAVTGEPGIGKTTLTETVATRAGDSGWRVALGHALGVDAPLCWPWPAIADQLGLVPPDPDGVRFDRFQAITEGLRALSETTPLLLILDDAHDADEEALLLARFVAAGLRGNQVVLMLTARAGEPRADERRKSLLDQLIRSARNVPLGPLDTAGLKALAQTRTQDPVNVDALGRLCGGNPLFAHHVLDLGIDAFDARHSVPSTTKSVLAERIRPLRASTRQILAEAAELGEPIDPVALASLTERSVDEIELALEEGERDRLLTRDTLNGRLFSHGLIRAALANELRPVVKRSLHAQARDRLAGPARTRESLVGRVAHHASEAADLSDPRSVSVAIDWCRRAARIALTSGDAQRAENLLGRAAVLSDSLPEGGARAGILVEQAEVSRKRGRLSEARTRFRVAAEAATREHDDDALARAALGRGGVWLREAHDATEYAGIRALQQTALARIRLRRPVQAARLEVRLAAERAYISGRLDDLETAIAHLRCFDDPGALAEALSLYHHVLLGPAHTHRRFAVASELTAVAATARDEFHGLMAVCWAAIDEATLGTRNTDLAIAAFAQRADAAQMEALQYIAELMRVMQATRDGQLDEAAGLAQRTLSLGQSAGDGDALLYYGTQLMVIRHMQGRTDELLALAKEVLSSPTLGIVSPALVAGYAVFAAASGDHEDARRSLRSLQPFADVPAYSGTLTMLYAACEAASILDDGELAREALELLEPFADLPTRPSFAVTCLGVARRAVGLAYRAIGDIDRSIGELEIAVGANLQLGNLPMVAITRADLATTLLTRSKGDDVLRAHELLAEAVAHGEALGLTGRVTAWRQLWEPGSDHEVSHAQLSRTPDGWEITTDESTVKLPDLIGFAYLADLIADPGAQHDTWQLVAAPSAVRDTLHQPVLDQRAITELRARARELQEALDAADARGDTEASDAHNQALEDIARVLSGSVNRRGRSRSFNGDRDRARSAVTKAIGRALDHIETVDSTLGASLRRGIHTGARCWFDAEAAGPVMWRLATSTSSTD